MDVLICGRVERSPDRYIVPGSIKSNCVVCGEPVYLSPSSQAVKDSMMIVCETCGLARMEKEEMPEIGTLDGQAEELESWRVRN